MSADVQERRTMPSALGGRGAIGVIDLSPDGRTRALMNMLDKCDTIKFGNEKLNRSTQQRQFHKAFMTAVLPKIYGAELYKHVGRLMREFDLDDMRTDVIVLAIRRAGKTMAVAMFSSAYVLTQPDTETSIYSTCQRTSRKLMALIWKLVVKLYGGASCIVRYNEEFLEVACCGSTAKINSLPSKVQISPHSSCLSSCRVPDTLTPPIFFFTSPPLPKKKQCTIARTSSPRTRRCVLVELQ